MSRKKKKQSFLFSIMNLLLTNLVQINGRILALFSFCMFMDCNYVLVAAKRKRTWPKFSHLNVMVGQKPKHHRFLKQVLTRACTLHELWQMRRVNTDYNWEEKPTIVRDWEIFVSWIPHSLPQTLSMWYDFLQSHRIDDKVNFCSKYYYAPVHVVVYYL